MGALYLIRHGQASFGKANYDALSDTGHEQGRVLGAALKARVAPDGVFRGSMRRHAETCDNALAAMDRVMTPVVLDGFDEYDHEEIIVRYKPRYTNKLLMKADLAKTLNPRKAFQTLITEAMRRWMAGDHDGEYRESWPQFQHRCNDAVEMAIEQLGPSKTGLVFTSGGAISAIVQRLLGLDDEGALRLQWTMANAGVTKLLYSGERRHLSSFNEHAHFEGDLSHLITYR